MSIRLHYYERNIIFPCVSQKREFFFLVEYNIGPILFALSISIPILALISAQTFGFTFFQYDTILARNVSINFQHFQCEANI